MGSYVTAANVQAWVLLVLQDANSNISAPTVSTTLLDSYIDQVEAELDSVLIDMGYTVPLTNARDINRVAGPVSRRVGAILFSVLFFGDENLTGATERWNAEWDALIDRLVNRDLRLISAARNSGWDVMTPEVLGT